MSEPRAPVLTETPFPAEGQLSVAPPTLCRSFQAATLFRALGRCWRRVVLLSLCCVTVGGAASWLAPLLEQQTVTARIRITSPEMPLPGKAETSATLRQDLASLARDPTLLAAVTAEPPVAGLACVRLRETPAAWLAASLQVEAPPGATTVTLALQGHSPQELALLVNAIAEAVVRQADARQQQAMMEEQARAETKRQAAQEHLRTECARLHEFLATAGVCDVSLLAYKQRLVLERWNEADRERRQVQTRRLAAVLERASLQGSTPDREAAFAVDPEWNRLSDRRRQLVQDMQQIERVSRLGKKCRPWTPIAGRLAALDQDIETRRRQLQVQQAAPFTEINLRRTVAGAADRRLEPARKETGGGAGRSGS